MAMQMGATAEMEGMAVAVTAEMVAMEEMVATEGKCSSYHRKQTGGNNGRRHQKYSIDWMHYLRPDAV